MLAVLVAHLPHVQAQGALPGATWSRTGHTAANVYVFATGAVFEGFPSLLDNTAIPALLSCDKFTGGQP